MSNFAILIKFGAQEPRELVLPDNTSALFGSNDIAEHLAWLPEQSLNVVITGLKSSASGTLLPFSRTQVPQLTILDDWDKKLENGHLYELVFTDLREADVSKLNETQLEYIKKGFRDLDKDGSGAISLEELRQHFAKKTHDHCARVDQIMQMHLEKANSETERTLIARKYSALKERERQFNDKRLKDLLAKDVNGDGDISLEEWIISEAPVVLARDSLRTSTRL